MNIREVETLYNYTQWAHRKVWGCIEALTDEQFVQDNAYSRGSIRNQFLHMLNVEATWLTRLKNQPRPVEPPNTDFPTRADVLAKWQTVEADWRAYLATLDDAALEVIIQFEAAGQPRQNPRWAAIVQVVNHGTDHRAQILALLWQMGAPTIEQDFPLYYWAQNPI